MKLENGGWYKTRDGSTVYSVNVSDDGYLAVCGSITWDRTTGRYYTGEETGIDLIERVNPPTPYVPTKKWKWCKKVTCSATTDMQYQSSIKAIMITEEHSAKSPDELDPDWYAMLDTEIET